MQRAPLAHVDRWSDPTRELAAAVELHTKTAAGPYCPQCGEPTAGPRRPHLPRCSHCDRDARLLIMPDGYVPSWLAIWAAGAAGLAAIILAGLAYIALR